MCQISVIWEKSKKDRSWLNFVSILPAQQDLLTLTWCFAGHEFHENHAIAYGNLKDFDQHLGLKKPSKCLCVRELHDFSDKGVYFCTDVFQVMDCLTVSHTRITK